MIATESLLKNEVQIMQFKNLHLTLNIWCSKCLNNPALSGKSFILGGNYVDLIIYSECYATRSFNKEQYSVLCYSACVYGYIDISTYITYSVTKALVIFAEGIIVMITKHLYHYVDYRQYFITLL